jgi:ribosomal protein S27AE
MTLGSKRGRRALDFFRACYAFYQSLFSRECEHANVVLNKRGPSFCPDCGYKILHMWVMVKCQSCDAKRLPRRMPDGKVRPMERFCSRCGEKAFRVVKRDKIDAFELHFGLSVKEIDYTEERRTPGTKHQPAANNGFNPFKANQPFDIVEGQVLRKRYFSQNTASAWEEAPFLWGDEKLSANHPAQSPLFKIRRQIS